MPVSAEIYGHIQQPRQRNMLSDFASVVGIQQGQQQNELARMNMDAARRDTEQQNTLADLWRGAIKPDGTVDRNALLSGAASRGLGTKIPGLQKQFADQDKAGADLSKSYAEMKAKELEAASKRIDIAGQAFGHVRQNPTPENAMAALDYLAQNGVYTPEQVEGFKAKVRAEPHKVGEMSDMAFRAAMSAKDQLAKISTQNLGGTSQTLSTDPVSGATNVLRSDAITQSADNLASTTASTENNKRTVGAQYAIANSNRDAANITAAGNRDAAKLKWNAETEMKMGDDYRKQSKDFMDAQSAYKQIAATLDSATKSPAATLAAATKFMKILDPGSVVRESELGMALAATGVIDRMNNYMNTLKYGKVLTANQVADFKDISAKIYSAAQEVQKRVDSDYQAKAQKYGLRPEMVTQDIGQNDQLQSPTATPSNGGWSIQRVDK